MKTEASRAGRILLVDDNSFGLKARSTILIEQGHQVETATSGETAWEMLQHSEFDVVVTDLRMGGMDGVELIRRIRESQSKTRTVLLSGLAGCLGMTPESTGADEVLVKSNRETQELSRTVRKLLAEHPRRRPPSREQGPSRRSQQAI